MFHLLLGDALHLLPEVVHPPHLPGDTVHLPGLLPEGYAVVLCEDVLLLLPEDVLPVEVEHLLDVHQLVADAAVLLLVGLFAHLRDHCLQGEAVRHLSDVQDHHPIHHLLVHGRDLGEHLGVAVQEGL